MAFAGFLGLLILTLIIRKFIYKPIKKHNDEHHKLAEDKIKSTPKNNEEA